MAIAALSFFRLFDYGKITHHEGVVPALTKSPVRSHPVYVRGGQVPDWEESQVLAALAVSELSAALQ